MATDFIMPDLGENIQSADVGQVLIAEGDTIKADQIVLELETDKAVFELPCPYAGKVAKIHVRAGDKVAVGDKILTVESVAGEKPAANAKTPPPSAKETPKPASPKPPERPAPAKPAAPTVAPPAPLTTTPRVEMNKEESPDGSPAPAGPATRRLARELGVDLHKVSGSGPGGRITTDDVQAFVRSAMAGGGSAASRVVAGPLPDFSEFGTTERLAMNKIAKTSAANLSLAWQVAPHVTQHDLADITDLEAGRKRFSEANKGGPKVTMTVLALKAVVAALKAYPHFNASLDADRDEVVVKKYYHVGIAVDTDNGLIVPVIKDVDKKGILTLAAEVTELAEKARSRKISLSDLKGGSFTISNLGGIGGTAFTPIVNYPEVAILGISKARWQQTMHEGAPALRLLLPLSVSYDHRVINGADGARFTAKLANLLSDPFALLAEC
ncbi:MAG: 2-oxo acid dehydrogenase subunit E2 [Planctomycetota bacterium]